MQSMFPNTKGIWESGSRRKEVRWYRMYVLSTQLVAWGKVLQKSSEYINEDPDPILNCPGMACVQVHFSEVSAANVLASILRVFKGREIRDRCTVFI